MLFDLINTGLLSLLVVVGGAAVAFAYRTSGQMAKILVMVAHLESRDDNHDKTLDSVRKVQIQQMISHAKLEGRVDEIVRKEEDQ